jgi:hypothetical protein
MKKIDAKQRVVREGGLAEVTFFETYQLMAYLGVSTGKVKLLMEAGLPHGKNGGKLIFKREQVDQWCSNSFFSPKI